MAALTDTLSQVKKRMKKKSPASPGFGLEGNVPSTPPKKAAPKRSRFYNSY